jgi:hypothetical protein
MELVVSKIVQAFLSVNSVRGDDRHQGALL